jgi:hypothetical protein
MDRVLSVAAARSGGRAVEYGKHPVPPGGEEPDRAWSNPPLVPDLSLSDRVPDHPTSNGMIEAARPNILGEKK